MQIANIYRSKEYFGLGSKPLHTFKSQFRSEYTKSFEIGMQSKVRTLKVKMEQNMP